MHATGDLAEFFSFSRPTDYRFLDRQRTPSHTIQSPAGIDQKREGAE